MPLRIDKQTFCWQRSVDWCSLLFFIWLVVLVKKLIVSLQKALHLPRLTLVKFCLIYTYNSHKWQSKQRMLTTNSSLLLPALLIVFLECVKAFI